MLNKKLSLVKTLTLAAIIASNISYYGCNQKPKTNPTVKEQTQLLANIDTLKIATYNLKNYPGSDGEIRNNYFRPVIQSMNPDILIVQEVINEKGVESFTSNVLNVNNKTEYEHVPFHNGKDSDNMLFYKKSKIEFVNAKYIQTSLREFAEYTVKEKLTGEEFKIFAVHLKSAKNGISQRSLECKLLREYLNNLEPNSKFLVAGDFNIEDSYEPGYIKLTENSTNNNGRMIDPINAQGKWHDNYDFRKIHTQSPRKRAFGGGASGGLDDRFDLILISEALQKNTLQDTYIAYGNDGNHLNDSINKNPNKAVADSIANGLAYASDHLPVICKFVFEKK